jgi:HAD superfamily hydrolase (TIGR01509 family)
VTATDPVTGELAGDPHPSPALVRRELRAVLFDMDGLLVDTEECWFRAETHVMERLAGSRVESLWGREQQAGVVGGPLEHATRVMLDLSGRDDVSPDEVGDWLMDEMESLVRTGPVHWMPGAQELLGEVRRAGLPTGLVSSSYRRIVEPVLDVVGRSHFEVTVARDDVTRTKPDPEPYVRAAAALGLSTLDCVALEDSPTGVRAARAAGCPTVAVPGAAPVPAGLATAVVGSLRDLDLAWLRKLVAG